MASPTVSWCQQFINLLVGQGEVAAKRVDATYINALVTDICRAIAERLSSGDKAVDAGSGINQTVITLYSDSNRTSQIKAGDWFQVTELATGSVWTGTCSVNDIISFSTNGVGVDGQLMSGAAPADYSAAAFIDDLRIEIRHQLHHEIQVDEINLTDGDVGALQTDNLLRPGGANLEADLASVEADFNAEHFLGVGNHRTEIIDNTILNIDCFAPGINSYESVENIVDGDFEYDDDGDGVVNGWLPYLAPPTVNLSAVQVIRGQWSQLVTTVGAGPGIHAYADWRLHVAAMDFQSKVVSFTVLLYDAGGGGTVDIAINDGVGVTTDTVGTAGAWDIFHITRTMDAAATTCEFRIYANQATTFYVGGVHAHMGRLNWGYHNAPAGTAHRLFRRSDYQNWFPNGDFKDWTNLWGGAAGAAPDWCTVTAGAPVIAQNAATFLYGQYSLDVTTVIGDAIQFNTVNPTDFVFPAGMERQTCCLSFYYYGVAGNPVLQVTVGDGVVNTLYTIYPTVGTWQRFIAFIEVQAAAVAQFLTITEMNIPGGNFLIDGLMFHRGLMPQAFQPSAGLQPYKWDFVNAGAAPAFPQNMTFHGSLLEAVVKSDMYVHRLMVNSVAAPGGIVIDTYDVLQNGVPVGITATVNGAATTGATHVPGGFLYNQGDLLQVLFTPGAGTAAANMSCAVEAYKIGS